RARSRGRGLGRPHHHRDRLRRRLQRRSAFQPLVPAALRHDAAGVPQAPWPGRLEHAPARPGIVARLESGRVGVAVELYEPYAEVAYALVPLDATPDSHPGRPTHRWDDVVKDVHRHMPP